MKFNIIETKEKTIDLSREDMAEIALGYFKEEFGIDAAMWIADGYLMEEKEYVTSHVWYDEEQVRKATKEDKAVLKVAKYIKKNLTLN